MEKPMKVSIKKGDLGGGIINWYSCIPKEFIQDVDNPNFHLHNFNLPFRSLVVAPSGSGKTNFVISLLKLFQEGEGTFGMISISTRNADEPLYNFLKKVTKNTILIGEGIQSLPKLDKLDKEINNLVVIDDLCLVNDQSKIIEYYIRCRKLNCSIIYLSQNYYSVPKVIRGNCSYLIILKLSTDRDMKMILKECSLGVDKEKILRIYEYATSEKFFPLIVSLDENDKNKKFRKGMTEFLDLDKF